MRKLTTQEAVDLIDAIENGDPERAHSSADDVLLTTVPEPVRDAYRRLQDRCSWWAHA